MKGDRVSHDAITDNDELGGRVRAKRVAVNGGGRSVSSLNSHTCNALPTKNRTARRLSEGIDTQQDG